MKFYQPRNVFLLLFSISFTFSSVFGQQTSPFVIKGEVEAPLFIASFSLMGGAYQFSQKNKISRLTYLQMKKEKLDDSLFNRSSL